MKTKEAIRFLKNTILWNLGDEAPIGKEKYQNLINNTIELLQRGEEYERILRHIGVISNNEQVNRIIRDTLLGG